MKLREIGLCVAAVAGLAACGSHRKVVNGQRGVTPSDVRPKKKGRYTF